MPKANIPSQIYDFRLYNVTSNNDLNQFVGNGSEVTLPTVTNITAETDLAGGKLDMPGMRTENMEIEIPFTLMDEEAASIMSLNNAAHLAIYGAAQRSKAATHDFENTGLRLEVKGYTKEIELGTLKRSDKMDSKVKLTLTYIKLESVDADMKKFTIMEIDVLNSVYIMNGVNVREGIDKFL